MMSALASWYPGHYVLDVCVIVGATVALVSATAWAVCLLLGRHPAVRHWVLLSALACTLASPMFVTAFVACGRSFISVPLLAAQDSRIVASGGDTDKLPLVAWAPAGRPQPDEVTPLARATHLPAGRGVSTTSPLQSVLVAVILIWLGGTAALMVRLVHSARVLRRLLQTKQPASNKELGALDTARRLLGARTAPSIGVSSRVHTPIAAGLFRPTIVLPAGLSHSISETQLCDVLIHELAHIERRDNVVVLLQAMARAMFWPILFVHLVNRELERAREDICDNHVLACRDAVTYGETLLRVAQLTSGVAMPAGALGILHWRGKLESRIFGLIHKGRSKVTRTPPIIALGVLGMFVTASAVLCGTTIMDAEAGEQKRWPVVAPATSETVGLKKDAAKQGDGNPLPSAHPPSSVWPRPTGKPHATDEGKKERKDESSGRSYWPATKK